MIETDIQRDPTGAGQAPVARLDELVAGLGTLEGDGGTVVHGLAIDSRTVSPGCLFIALRGLHTDGHRHVGDAVGRGACAVVVEESVAGIDRPVVQVVDSNRALAVIATRFHRHPSHVVPVLGVTGTNGKTTVTHLVAAAFDAAGRRGAVLGTLGAGFRGALREIGYTTPTAERFQAVLRQLVDEGADAVVTEISSHALKTERTFGTRFAVTGFTNLTRDHLDFHVDEADYLDSKLRLFDRAARGDDAPATAVVHLGDRAAPHFVERARRSGDRVLTAGIDPAADIGAGNVALDAGGTSLELRFPGGTLPVRLCLAGGFNVANALVAFGMALAGGVDPAHAVTGLEAVERVPGRLERVDGGGPIGVLIDFAHTPDALETVLTTVRGVTPERLLVVFGCGGDRDRGKRPLMAGAGTRLADIAVLTSDNPRTEQPAAILADMETGVEPGSRYEVIADRRQAIRRAIGLARPGDIVLIAGKGHEAVQIIGEEKRPFDDRAEAVAALVAAGLMDAGEPE